MCDFRELREFNGASDMMKLCIRRNWFNAGNNFDYHDMLKECYGIATLDNIEKIAKKIYENTEISIENLGYQSSKEYIADMISDIIKYATHTFIIY